MNTEQIANRLVELCRKANFEAAQKELFAPNAVSLEPYVTPVFDKETKGLDAIIEKGHRFQSMVQEMHSISVSEPLMAGQSFAVNMTMDVTMKEHGRMNMAELCVYDVKDGKIVAETFHI